MPLKPKVKRGFNTLMTSYISFPVDFSTCSSLPGDCWLGNQLKHNGNLLLWVQGLFERGILFLKINDSLLTLCLLLMPPFSNLHQSLVNNSHFLLGMQRNIIQLYNSVHSCSTKTHNSSVEPIVWSWHNVLKRLKMSGIRKHKSGHWHILSEERHT